MPQDRFFIDSHFSPNQTLLLQDLEFHHLVNVMRVKENETIEMVNGQGQLGFAKVIQINKKNAQLTLSSVSSKTKPPTRLILAQALPRLNRLDFILEKVTELGVTDFWLFPGKFSEKRELNLPRAHQITIAAMKQSGRLFSPTIQFFSSIEQCPIESIKAYFGDVSENAPPLKSILKPDQSNGIFIGPEKGFSAGETEWLIKKGAEGVTLSENILRTDTAAIASIAQIIQLLI